MDMQPCRLQRWYKRPHIRSQQLHQHHAHDGQRHGDRADHFHFEFLLRDQREYGERPHKHEQHFVDTGEWGMPRFIPAMCNRARVGDQSRPCGERGKPNVSWSAGNPESEIKRSCAGIKNECRVQQIGVGEQVTALDDVQKGNEQQEGNSQPDRDHQGCAGGYWLLFDSCARHKILRSGIYLPVSTAADASAPASTEILSSDSIFSTRSRNRCSKASLFLFAVPPIQSCSWPRASRSGTTQTLVCTK